MRVLREITRALAVAASLAIFIVPAIAASSSSTVTAGFTDLPLRKCQGTYCGVVKRLPMGQQLRVLFNDTGGGWSYVEVVGTGEKGWVCNDNVF
ncbi:SH3 domain-containing protein [Fundidesulfovibrio soli]|uniref:SH3 domain-containing protein n=1 Tax=Fundidesulfovibrio soli TaxID=2922716 RepID=UPI001FAF64A6|nr:SH3 domain-containing protein [Fundidesulfovibrio soli]